MKNAGGWIAPLLSSVVASMVCCGLVLCVLCVPACACSWLLCVLWVLSRVFLVAVCVPGCCTVYRLVCVGYFFFWKKNKKNGQKGKRLPRYGSTFALLRPAETSSAYNLNPLSVQQVYVYTCTVNSIRYSQYMIVRYGTVQSILGRITECKIILLLYSPSLAVKRATLS